MLSSKVVLTLWTHYSLYLFDVLRHPNSYSRVWHPTLLWKLAALGIPSDLLKWRIGTLVVDRVPHMRVGSSVDSRRLDTRMPQGLLCFVSLRVDLPTVWHDLGHLGFGGNEQITFSLYIIVCSVNLVISCFWGVCVSHCGPILGVPRRLAGAQQCSLLSPIFFVMFISHLPCCLHEVDEVMA